MKKRILSLMLKCIMAASLVLGVLLPLYASAVQNVADGDATILHTAEDTVVYGDANGDDEVNGKDVIILRKYMANYDYDTGTSTMGAYAGADANGDGEVNGKDVIMLPGLKSLSVPVRIPCAMVQRYFSMVKR